MQKLLLPYKNGRFIIGYKDAEYLKIHGYQHYGIDSVCNDKDGFVYAAGVGEVVLSGFDGGVGNSVAIIYKDVLQHTTGKIYDIVIRYFHLDKLCVSVGDKVDSGVVIGTEGKTGAGNWGTHLHSEADFDIEWFQYTPQVAHRNNALIKKSPAGHDSTMDIMSFMHTRFDFAWTGYGGFIPVVVDNIETESEVINLDTAHELIRGIYDELAAIDAARENINLLLLDLGSELKIDS